MNNGDRIIRYVERMFQRSGCTEFPTVRQIARALRLRQSEVWEWADGSYGNDNQHLMVSYYNVEWEAPIGDWFVETL
jgi:hypothetical protein